MREGRGSAARCPFRPGTAPYPARRAGTQAARAARASPRTKGPAPETGRGRGETEPASQAAARGRGGRAPPPRGPTRGVALVAAAAGGGGALGSGPRGPQADPAPHSLWEDCRGAKTLASGAPGAVTASFQAHSSGGGCSDGGGSSYPGSGIGGGGGGGGGGSTSAPVTTSALARAPPLRRLFIGRAGHGVAPAAREGRRPREEGELIAGMLRPVEGGGQGREQGGGGRRGTEMGAGRGKRRWKKRRRS